MAIEIDTGRFEARRKSLQRRSAEQHSVNTDTRTCRQGGTQECRYRRRFSKTVLHQLYARAVELRGRLNEISRISPQQGTVERHNKVARRACKARQPTANLPVCRQIFTQVRIGLRHHHSGNPRLPHHISQRVQTRNIHIIHISQYFNISHFTISFLNSPQAPRELRRMDACKHTVLLLSAPS